MKNNSFKLKNLVAALLSTSMAMQTLLGFAASTDIGDVPMVVKNAAKPNLVFTLDNSGSMRWTFMPGDNADDAEDRAKNRSFTNHLCNRIYYNPDLRYEPPKNWNGTSFSNARFDAAWLNGFDQDQGKVDLRSKFYVLYYANARDDDNGDGPAFYSKHKASVAPAAGTCDSDDNYTIVKLDSSYATYPTPEKRTDCAGAQCTLAEEQQNFANWFSYYRTRMFMAKTSIGKAFQPLGSKFRIGFNTINSGSGNDASPNNDVTDGDNWLTIRDFDDTQKQSWFSTLYGRVPNGGTPLRSAEDKIGKLFSGTLSGATDPVIHSCQRNYHILSTDGYWNDHFSGIGDQDGSDSGYSKRSDGVFDANGASNTLADIALYYYKNDLRPSMLDNIPVTTTDKAEHQHMSTYTIGMGANGTKPYIANYLDASERCVDPGTAYPCDSPPGNSLNDPDYKRDAFFTKLKAGDENWPAPSRDDLTAIDDLWHAAVAGRGRYLSAANPAELADSVSAILTDIIGREGGAAAVAVSNTNVVSGDNASYASAFDSSTWSGDLNSYLIDPGTGAPSSIGAWVNGSAAQQLDRRAVTATTRKIATYDGASGVGFNTTALSASQIALLNTPSKTDGAAVLAYLRGSRANEGQVYRRRSSRLGDTINAEPVIMNPPYKAYSDTGYAEFKAAQVSRAKIVFQGANDGMLHAFGGDQTQGGDEKWAYIPGLLLPKVNNLSRLDGFNHRYYVDATPALADVDLGNTDGGSGTNWQTILVGGLAKGGFGYYALKVTDPAAADDAAVASKVLWEFPKATTNATVKANIGFSYSKPIIVKTEAKKWVVIVASGYNNGTDTGGSGGDGQGHLFVLNARTGELIKDISTGVGSATDPSGLAYISGRVHDDHHDSTVDFVYGGDLKGNVWRFDLTGNNTNQWNVKKLASLVDGSGNAQPITSPPELGRVNGKNMVFVGTGLYLGEKDIPGAVGANASTSQTQSFYGLYDNDSTTPEITSLRTKLIRQTVTGSETTRTTTSNAVALSASVRGWYIDFPTSGERLVSEPLLVAGTILFNTIIPTSDICTPGGSSWQYGLNYANGGVVPGFSSSGTYLGNVLASRSVVVKLTNGKIRSLVRTSGKATDSGVGTGAAIIDGVLGGASAGGILSTDVNVSGSTATNRRVSWRELMRK